ncbi:type IV secretion system protein [Sphingobium olei]|uniref:Type IV secretion system protein n=1 Tax=Sphingobium olei TaxID=420955 RepID=A0ABW3P2T9_9SPHN
MFVALVGFRMLMGQALPARDMVGGAIKIGAVLALASSWPAWRVVGYDLVLDGPAEVAHSVVQASGIAGPGEPVRDRLQQVDEMLVALTLLGTGRANNPAIDGNDPGPAFRSIALPDEAGYAWGRVLFLAGAIGPFAILRFGAGLLLALAPLVAGLLLFGGTRAIFIGWARGLVFCALGSLVLTVAQAAQVVIMLPWASDVVAQRAANGFTPSAPTELLTMSLAFAGLMAGMLFLMSRVAFQGHDWALQILPIDGLGRTAGSDRTIDSPITPMTVPSAHGQSRAAQVSEVMAATLRREDWENTHVVRRSVEHSRHLPDQATAATVAIEQTMLGNSFRSRRHRGASMSSEIRDGRA